MRADKSERPFGSEGRETYDERLNHILEAATEVIARDGYEKASMRAIAAAAGVSIAGLYHYFDGKERMLFLIEFRTFSALLNTLREKLHGVDDAIEQTLARGTDSRLGEWIAKLEQGLIKSAEEIERLKEQQQREERHHA